MSGVLYVFGDESGIEGTAEYCILAGFSGTPRQWEKFRKEWSRALKDYDVERFHAKDFYQRERRKNVDPYRDWDDDRASAFLGELLKAINRRVLKPISTAIHVPSFNSFSEEERRYLTGGIVNTRVVHELGSKEAQLFLRNFQTTGAPSRPYLAILQRFIGEGLLRAPDGAKVHFVFDTNNVMRARAVETFQEQFKSGNLPPDLAHLEKKATSITFTSSVDEEPLQAADLLAYLTNRILRNRADSRLMKETLAVVSEKTASISVFRREHLQGVLDHTATTRLADGIQRLRGANLW